MTTTAHPCPLCGNDLHDHPQVCGGCRNRGERDLRDLPRLTRQLLDAARDPTHTTGEPVTGSRENPLPLQAAIWSFVGPAPPGTITHTDPADDLCQTGDPPLADVLHAWCANAADDLDGTPPRIRRNTNTDRAVEAFTHWLLAQHHRTCELPWAADYLTEIHGLWATARTLAQDWPLVHKLPAPCPDCWTLTLRRDNGASFVYCDNRHGGCGRRWTEADYEWLVRILVSDAKESGWVSPANVAHG